MKRFFLKLLIFLFILCSFNLAVYASTYKTEVKVGLIYGSSTSAVEVISPGGVAVFNAVTGDWLYSSAYNELLTINMSPSGFFSDNKFYADEIKKISVQPQNGANILCNGKEYHGYIYLEIHPSGTLTVINIVGTDSYVASVLGKEMSYSWPAEALKAQSVCARNFVLTCGNAHSNYGFDVCATTHCQVYGGVASEHANTIAATKATKGILAYYKNSLVPLYFFATSGGHTEDVENVWSSALGYLRGVPDPYENPSKATYYKWSITLTRSEIESKLIKAGYDIGTLNSFSIDKVSPSGRVLQMTFSGTGGQYVLKKEKCRTVFGFYSNRFSVDAPEISTPDPTLMQVYTTSGTAVAPSVALSAAGIQNLSDYSVLSASGQVVTLSANASENTNPSYTFNGGGYGHGVGMSQWGARGMAENGFTYDQILRHYFTNIVLQ